MVNAIHTQPALHNPSPQHPQPAPRPVEFLASAKQNSAGVGHHPITNPLTTLQFGKKDSPDADDTVAVTLFNQRIHIPKAVHNVAQCVEVIEFNPSGRNIHRANTVYLGKNHLLTTVHGHNLDSDDPFDLLDVTPGSDIATVHQARVLHHDIKLDLGVLETGKNFERLRPKTDPIALAERDPRPGERLYLVGWERGNHPLLYIPLRAEKKIYQRVRFKDQDEQLGSQAIYMQVSSKAIDENPNIKRFTTSGLSGSPVVNERGELVGIYAASNPENGGTYEGYMLTRNTVARFLKRHQLDVEPGQQTWRRFVPQFVLDFWHGLKRLFAPKRQLDF